WVVELRAVEHADSEVAQDVREERVRPIEAKLDRGSVDLSNVGRSQPSERRPSLRLVLRIEDEPKRMDHVVGGELLAVVEDDAVTDADLPDARVRVRRKLLG